MLVFSLVIVTNDFEVRVGARTLLTAPKQQLRVQPGDRIGLVGRNGAGKTTTMRILAGETEPYGGSVTRSGEIGYLPQDSREGNLEQTARDRVLSARGLDTIMRNMDRQQEIMETTEDPRRRDQAIKKYARLEERYHSLGGYEGNAEAAQICDTLGLPARVLDQPLKTLSGASGAGWSWPKSYSRPPPVPGNPPPPSCWTSPQTTWMRTPSCGCGSF